MKDETVSGCTTGVRELGTFEGTQTNVSFKRVNILFLETELSFIFHWYFLDFSCVQHVCGTTYNMKINVKMYVCTRVVMYEV